MPRIDISDRDSNCRTSLDTTSRIAGCSWTSRRYTACELTWRSEEEGASHSDVGIAEFLDEHREKSGFLLGFGDEADVNGGVGDLLEELLHVEAVFLKNLDELRSEGECGIRPARISA